MDPYLKAPLKMRCGDVSTAIGEKWTCLRFAHHDGPHADEPYPGETVTWPESAGPLEQPAEADVDVANTKIEPDPLAGLRGPFTGLLGPFGLARDTEQQRQEHRAAYEAEQASMRRLDTVEMAVRALTPLAGAYLGVDDYADAITRLADKLGAYIQGGEQT